MTKTLDTILKVILIGGLSLAFFGETANLIGFGMQEHYLQHPDYPEGPDYKRDLQEGKIQLAFWTIITAGLLGLVIYSRIKNNRQLFNQTALATFIGATFLALLLIINGGSTTGGLIWICVTLTLIGLTLIKMKIEKK